MAIAFARPEYVSRSNGANACCKSAYNARAKIKDEKSNITYNFSSRLDNDHHAILLPTFVDQKFKNPAIFANEVEASEKRKDSQLYVEWVLALPKDKNISFELKQEMVYEFIRRKNWVAEGLGVQVDIHAPHDGEVNWHAHLLVTTRRFLPNELGLESKKAIDLQPEVRFGKVQKTLDIDNNLFWRDVQNDLFKSYGLDNRVDLNGEVTQEHIGPIRMRSSVNQKQVRNYERQIANIESLNSGARVLDRITNHTSVFNENDIRRAVSFVPSPDDAQSLIKEALSNKDLEALYDESGNSTGFYTTKEVRSEELKLLRLADYLAAQKNVIEAVIEGRKGLQSLLTKAIAESEKSLSSEQQESLSYLLLGTSGIRILRGRAGTGKSFVLATIAEIAVDLNINIIGLAPTHKARIDLASNGYTQNDTIKGMLFKLHNGRFKLPKRSLIVVDEAGQIGNDDYLELLRVAAKQRCNVICSGDEKQLTSVRRGGMFEVFAEKYDSKLLFDIRRQNSEWGREVATAFASGEVATGVRILQRENRIVEAPNKESSIKALLNDWSASEELLSHKLILAVKNIDVDILNAKVRGYLKANKTLRGAEFAIKDKLYMQGERILITQTNKELNLTNGDLAEITFASKEKFTIKINSNATTKEISFDPSKYQGFSHGYATTVFKSQGASINSVFVFHDGFAGLRNSYVALSRNIKELKLYTNKAATQNLNHLIKQLSNDHELSSSLNYFTKEDLNKRSQLKRKVQEKGVLSSIVSNVASLAYKKLTEVADKHLELAGYYNYEEPKITNEQIEIVLDSCIGSEEYRADQGAMIKIEVASEANAEVLAAASGNRSRAQISVTKTTQSPKERFYNNEEWARERERFKSEVKFKAELIAHEILGTPNKRLSNSKTLRFGGSGKIAVRISGEGSGQWYDFSASTGGDLFALVQEHKACDFKEASDYLRSITGIRSNSHLKLVYDHQNSELTKAHIGAKQRLQKEEIAKQQMVSKLRARSKEIRSKSIAHHYLEKRSITCHLSEDIRTTGIIGSEQSKYYPAIVVFARDAQDNITGGQQILLDKTLYTKADIYTPKKSFGKIAGSFVNVGSIIVSSQDKKSVDLSSASPKCQITIIAEGLETALSVKQALAKSSTQHESMQIKVLCSLGISNISNYPATSAEKIIIAADNDGLHSSVSKTIEFATKTLQGKGAFVEVVSPDQQGDFNDILQKNGEEPIQMAFANAINKHSSKTIAQFFVGPINNQLSKQEIEDLKYIQSYNLPEAQIVDAYRKDPLKGLLALEHLRKALSQSIHAYEQNHSLIEEAGQWGYAPTNETKINTIKSLVGVDESLVQKHFQELRNNHLTSYLNTKLQLTTKQKEIAASLSSIYNAVQNEQKILKETFESLKSPIDEYGSQNKSLLQSGELASKRRVLIQDTFNLADTLLSEGCKSEALVFQTLKDSTNIQTVHTNLDKALEVYNINNTLTTLSKEKQKADSHKQIIDLLKQEQEFLINLESSLKYPEYYSDIILNSIKQAKQNKQDNVITSLHKLSTYLVEKNLKKPEEVMKVILSTNDPAVSHHGLLHDYHTHVISEVDRSLARIDQGHTAAINGEHFDCTVKFLDTLLKTHEHNEFLPRASIQRIQTRALEHQKSLEMSKDFDGPSL
ncbi:MAG: AAA family ATPase [Pseudomonadota bacterium]